MTEHIKRLTKSARSTLELPDEDRILKIQQQTWIPYDQANKLLEELDLLFNYPQKDRMPNLLIVGSTNNGKSTILKKFMQKYPDYVTAENVKKPIVYIQAPTSGGSDALHEKILDAVNAPYSTHHTASRKEKQAGEILKSLDTKMLIIDEFQDIFHGGASREKKFLATVKHLSNQLQVPIIAAGVEKVQSVISKDPQMANRFEPIFLPKWKFDEDYIRLLMSIETTLPLHKPSLLHKKKVAALLYGMSEGILGELMTIISRAGVMAIQKGKEQIDEDILKSIRFTKPADRRLLKSGH